MQLVRVTCLSFAVMLCLWLMPDGVRAQYSSVVAVGQKEFRSYCATCQGLMAKGDSPSAALLKSKPPESAYPPRSGWLAGLGRLKDG